jgi:TonB-dependent receptor
VGAYPNNTEKFFVDGLSSFQVDERTTAGYVMGDLGAKSDPYHLNFGVRIVRTDLRIDNGQSPLPPAYVGTAVWNGVSADVVPTTYNRSYTDVLPSVNFTWDFTDRQILRLSAARVVSPQDLFLLGLGGTNNFTRETGGRVNIHTGLRDGFAFDGGSTGNPNLNPYRANQGLISYENYFTRGAVFTVSGFWKQIDNFVEIENVSLKVADDFGGTTANVHEPFNAGRGRIYGLELGGQYAFGDNGWAWLKGFGVAGNYTYSDSQTDSTTSFSTKTTIPGVSKNSLTGTGYYERYGFSARVSYSWRDVAVNDSAVGSTFSFPDQTGTNHAYQVYQAPYGQLDAQVGYDITPNLGLVLSVQNVTDEAQHTFLQYKNLPFTYEDAGRRYFLGVKFKY